MIDLGVVRPGSTVRIPFTSFDKDDGSAITMTNYAAADILVYKDGGTTERASTAGYTATTDFDGKTGKHLAIIDLSDNTTAGFWNAGSEYLVAIDSVTIDAVTTGGWIARFRIGYAGAMFDTTIATLSSQTSFTLTAGPAEDNALVGCQVVIHDIASAVQCSMGVISAYTGSTKTVTLAVGPTFTVSAGDNISVMFPMPLQPTTFGRTLDVSTGGEAGVDWANVGSPTTALNLSGTTVKTATDVETDTQDIQSRLPAALGANGNIKADVRDFNGTAGTFSGGRPEVNTTHAAGTAWNSGAIGASTLATDTITAAKIAADAIGASELAADAVTEIQSGLATSSALTSLQSDVTTLLGRITSSLFSGITSLAQWLGAIAGKQTADSTARTEIRATGAGSGTYDETTDSQEALRDRGDAAWTTATGFSTLDAAGVRAAVGLASANLDTQLAALPTAAENASAVWDEDLSGHTTSGSAGDTLSSAGSAGDPWATALPGAYGAGTAGKILGDNLDAQVSTRLASASYSAPLDAAGVRTAVGLASANLDAQLDALPTAAENASTVWDEDLSGHATAGSAGAALSAAGTAGDPWSTPLPGAYGAGTAGQIIGDNLDAAVSSRLPTSSYAAPLDAAGTRTAVGLAAANLDTQLSAIDAKTTNLPSDPADESLIIAATDAIYARLGAPAGASVSADIAAVKTDTAAIKTKTNNLPASPAAVSDIPTAAANADAVWDEALAGHAGAGSAGAALSAASSGADPAAIADAVWEEAIVDHSGTAGSTAEALTDAGAGGNPWNTALEGSFTAGDIMRILAAIAGGKDTIVKTGGNTATVTFRAIDDSADRVVGTMENSRRVDVTFTP